MQVEHHVGAALGFDVNGSEWAGACGVDRPKRRGPSAAGSELLGERGVPGALGVGWLGLVGAHRGAPLNASTGEFAAVT